MRLKFFVAPLVAASLVSSAAYAAGDASVMVNGQMLDDAAYIIDGRTYVPLRAIGEALGAEVSWDGTTASVDLNEESAAISVIHSAGESVVAVVGTYKSRSVSQSVQDYNELYAHGAGVVIKSNGTILTNAHVVDEIDNITVIFGSGESYGASVLFSDAASDLALIKINKLGLKPITFAKENDLTVGQTVIAIGTPMSLNMINSASKGIISGTNVNIGQPYLFTQSDVATNGGNSGGALVNLKGELVGINSIKYVGSSVEGMSFSIPVGTINYILSSYEKYGKVLRPDTGVMLTESWESKIGVPTTKGLTVASSQNPALLPGDMVIKVNDCEVHSMADYNEAIKKTYTGGSLTFTYSRGGSVSTVEIEPLNS